MFSLAVADAALIVAIVVVFLGAAIALSLWARTRRIVRQTSSALSSLDGLNARYADRVMALPVLTTQFRYSATSKGKYDRFDLNDYARSCVLEREASFQAEIEARENLSRVYSRYSGELMRIGETQVGKTSDPRVKPAHYEKIEQRIFRRRILANPTPLARIVTVASYVSPRGRNSYSRQIVWDFLTLKANLHAARQQLAQRSTTSYLRAQERRLLTPSLRADILRRDRSRCRMCGASAADGVVLHIDHVIPISHGGRTVHGNLQTLCQSCNLGKSNRFVG